MISKYKNILTTAGLFLAAIIIAFATKAYIVQPYIVDGQSMENTLQDGDRLLVNKLPRTFARISGHTYTPKRGDIIIFNQANLPGFDGEKQLIKRVIGLPGDRVIVKDGSIKIINKTSANGFNPDTSGLYKISATETVGTIDLTLSSNQIFVCGDNRNNSEDSRYFGPINESQIVGKLTLRIFPISKASHY